jgi:hypothetical protein
MCELRQVQRVAGYSREKSVQEGQPYIREDGIFLRFLVLEYLVFPGVIRRPLVILGL